MPTQELDNSNPNNPPPTYRIPPRVNVHTNGNGESDSDDIEWSEDSSVEDGAADIDEDGNATNGLPASKSPFRQHKREKNRDRNRHPDGRGAGSRWNLEVTGNRPIGIGRPPEYLGHDIPRPEPTSSTVGTNYYPGEHVVPFYNTNNPFKPTPSPNVPLPAYPNPGPSPYPGSYPGPAMYPGPSYPGMVPPPLGPVGPGPGVYPGPPPPQQYATANHFYPPPPPQQQYAPANNFRPAPPTVRPDSYPPPHPGYPGPNSDARRDPDLGSSSPSGWHGGLSIRPPPERPARPGRGHTNTRRRSYDYPDQIPQAQRQGGRPPGRRSATSRRVAGTVPEYDELPRLSEERLQQAQAQLEAMEEAERRKRKEMLEKAERQKALDEKEKELAMREKLLEEKLEEEKREKLIQNTVEKELRRRSAASNNLTLGVPRLAPVGGNSGNALRREIYETQRMIEHLTRALQTSPNLRPGGGHIGHYFPPNPAEYFPEELMPVPGPYTIDHPRYLAPRYPTADYRTTSMFQQVIKRLERLEHNIATQPDLSGYYPEDEKLVGEYVDEPLDAGPEDDKAKLLILKKQIADIEARQLGTSHVPKPLHEGQGELESVFSTDETHSDINSAGKRQLSRIRVTGREQQRPPNPASPAGPGIMKGGPPRPISRASSGKAARFEDVPDEDDTRQYTHRPVPPTRGAMNIKATRTGIPPSNRQDGYDSGMEAESRGLKRTPMPYEMTGTQVKDSRLERFGPPRGPPVPDAPSVHPGS